MKEVCGIYKITSPSGRVYIGQSKNILKYRESHYRRGECESQPKLCNSINKYGFENHIFEIIEECEFEQLNIRERFWQDHYDVLNGGLNCVLTSTEDLKAEMSQETKDKMSHSRTGMKRSEEAKENIRKSKLGEKNPMYGKTGELNPLFGIPLSEERKKEQSERMMGRYIGELSPWYGQKYTPETIEYLKEIRKGTNQGEENPWFGCTHSDETKELMSKIKLESLTVEKLEFLKEISIIGTATRKEKYEKDPSLAEVFKDNCSAAKAIYNYIKIDPVTLQQEEFASIREIIKKYPAFIPQDIYKVCKGISNTSKGFIWRRKNKITGEILYPPKKENKRTLKVIDVLSGVIYKSISEASRISNIKNQTLQNQLSGRNRNKTSLMYLDKYLEIKLDLNNGDF